MGKPIKPVILGGDILGYCPKCRGDYQGHIFRSQIDDKNTKIEVKLRCRDCGHQGDYFIKRQDGLPRVELRHASNGRLLESRRKRKKPKNPDGALKGQLAFKMTPVGEYKYSVGHDGSGGSK